MSRIEKQLIALICLLLSTSLFSCGSDEENEADDGDALTIAWIPKEMGNEVFQIGLDGANLKALELTQSTGRDVEIMYVAPQDAADIQGQRDSIQEAIDAEVDAIAISCSSPEVASKVDEAIAAGIPVMAWDSDCRYPNGDASGRITYYGIDCRTTGQTVGELTGAVLTEGMIEKPWKVGIFSGVPLSGNLQERVAGVWDTLKAEGACVYEGATDPQLVMCWPTALEAAPETATYHVYRDEPEKCQNAYDENSCATVYAEYETEACGTQLDEMVSRDRDGDGEADLDAAILIGLWPLFAYSADAATNGIPQWTARMQDGTLKTITYDTLKFQIDMANAGLINAMVGQKYWGWGYDVIQMMYDYLENGAQYDSAFYDSGADVVCPNNWDEMSLMWTSSDFTQELSACTLLE
ncbi:MAG: substrate-binding domain-containing protein [Deltaproteobacteria bacterium]|nr:substrate-binding domain-containing protein [Deltaproteobacteria bacterium]MBN2672334.1 substrate-binding domain-containing protein [Deltaproteobacteria bacterium]